MTSQNNFNFVTPELTHRVELILHLLEYSNHIVIVKGEHESGKSTLCDVISNQNESNLILRKLSVTTHTTEDEVLKTIINGSEDAEQYNEKTFSRDDLNQWLLRCQGKQQIPALLIDNVDLFSDEMVNSLLEIIVNSNVNAALHVCLFCEPSFLQRLEEPGIKQDDSRSLHIIEMPGLSEKQAEQYIRSKYPSDETTDFSLFDEKTIKQIHRVSHGMPGRINALCEQYLDDPAKNTEVKNEKKYINVKEVFNKYKTIFVVAILLLVFSTGVTTLLYQTENKETKQTKQTIKLDLPEHEQEQELQELVNKDIVPETMTDEPEPVEIEELSTPVIPALANDTEKTSDVFVAENNDEAINPVEETQTINVDEAITEEQSVQDEIKGIEQTKVETVIQPESEPEQEPEQETAPAPAKATPKEPVKDINWLIQQNPNYYVLQLVGANEQETINFYLRSFKEIEDQIISFTTTNKGKPWHVLVYGLFENRHKAVMAIEGLPKKARQTAPWPRTVASIKEIMQK